MKKSAENAMQLMHMKNKDLCTSFSIRRLRTHHSMMVSNTVARVESSKSMMESKL